MLALFFFFFLLASRLNCDPPIYPVPDRYLKLSERRGSRVAFNKGSAGMPMNGVYSRAVKMEAQGPIANDDQNRAIRMDPKSVQGTPRVDLKYVLLPREAPVQTNSTR